MVYIVHGWPQTYHDSKKTPYSCLFILLNIHRSDFTISFQAHVYS